MRTDNGGRRADSTITISDYSLPDAGLMHFSNGRAACLVWRPLFTAVVIGRGSKVREELCTGNILADRVPVMQRPSGGCAVVLTPEMIVVSMAVREEKQLLSSEYFRRFNEIVISALCEQRVPGLAHRGISDIAIGPKKIAGTALYRNRERVFYHAVVNESGATDLMERYLLLPPRTPDYRAGRSHSEFVTSLKAEGVVLDFNVFSLSIERAFMNEVESLPQ